jgi:hypothetical protein
MPCKHRSSKVLGQTFAVSDYFDSIKLFSKGVLFKSFVGPLANESQIIASLIIWVVNNL